jgi:hypothetical protein
MAGRRQRVRGPRRTLPQRTAGGAANNGGTATTSCRLPGVPRCALGTVVEAHSHRRANDRNGWKADIRQRLVVIPGQRDS